MGDKSFQANCIRSLIAYLSTHGYDQSLTPKMLVNPMTKDVISVYLFLLRQVCCASLASSDSRANSQASCVSTFLTFPQPTYTC